MPTLIGIIFFFCGVYYFFFQEEGLLGMLIVASTFQAASAINIAGRGIQPYYIIAIFIILRAIYNRAIGHQSRKMAHQSWFLSFGIIAIASAFVLPVLFAGIPVYDPKIGIDDGLFIRPPLKIGLNNIGQAGFLAVQIGVTFATLGIRSSYYKTQRGFLWAFYLVSAFVLAQSLGQIIGVPIPDSFLRNNPGYAIQDFETGTSGTRNPGPFTEPSAAGAFLIVYCISFLVKYLSEKEGSFRVIASFAVSALVASSSSILVLLFFSIALIVCYSPYRFPWYLSLRRSRRIVWLLFTLASPMIFALLLVSSYRETLTTFTVSKGESGSFINRTASDLYSMDLLIPTHGLGVGLGSNRASSLATTLVSNIGVVGFTAFIVFYCKLFWKLAKKEAWLKWAGFALFMNMCLGVADVTIPFFWIPIILAIQLRADETSLVPTETNTRRMLPETPTSLSSV